MLLDASVWISWLLSTDTFHRDTDRWFTPYLAAGGQVAAPIILLSEVGGALMRRTGRVARSHRTVLRLENLGVLHLPIVDQRLGRSAATLAVDLRLRGTDAVYVALAHELGVPLVTWD